MEKVCIGKIVNTHGIKGEIRILSDFEFKDKAFKVNTNVIIDDKEYKILTYRKHKNFDMITLEGFTNINDVLFMMKKKVYKDKNELSLNKDEVLDEDLITFDVVDDSNNVGKITEIFYASKTNKILRVMFDKEVLIPMSSFMIKKIDVDKKEIQVELIEGMK